MSDAVPAKVGLGLAGITAAALLAAIARRRVLQQRARPPGRRIALPDPDARAVETGLRAADDRDTLRRLRSALLQLATGCSQAGRDLPAVGAVCVTRNDIELHLLHAEVDAVEPFMAVNATRWRASLDDLAHRGRRPDDGRCRVPLPGTADRRRNREQHPADRPRGGRQPHRHRQPRRRHTGAERLGRRTRLRAGLGHRRRHPRRRRLALRCRLTPPGYACSTPPATAARRAAVRTRDVADILDAAQVESLREARSRGVAHDAWDPEIVLWHSGDDRSPREVLLRAAGPGLAVVTSTTSEAVELRLDACRDHITDLAS